MATQAATTTTTTSTHYSASSTRGGAARVREGAPRAAHNCKTTEHVHKAGGTADFYLLRLHLVGPFRAGGNGQFAARVLCYLCLATISVYLPPALWCGKS